MLVAPACCRTHSHMERHVLDKSFPAGSVCSRLHGRQQLCFMPDTWVHAGAHWVVHWHAEGQQQPPHHPQGCLIQQRNFVRLPLSHAHDRLHQHQPLGSANSNQCMVHCCWRAAAAQHTQRAAAAVPLHCRMPSAGHHLVVCHPARCLWAHTAGGVATSCTALYGLLRRTRMTRGPQMRPALWQCWQNALPACVGPKAPPDTQEGHVMLQTIDSSAIARGPVTVVFALHPTARLPAISQAPARAWLTGCSGPVAPTNSTTEQTQTARAG